MSNDETRYQVLRLFEANPELSQRDIARALGVSVGKVNYCVKALVRRGWIKVDNFKNSGNKAAYMYLLTARGIEQKSRLTLQFLKKKMEEYEILQTEIRRLRQEIHRRG